MIRILFILLSFFAFHTGIAQNSISLEGMENIFPKSILKCKLHQEIQSTEIEVKTEQVKNVKALYANKEKTIEVEWLQFTNPGSLYQEAVASVSDNVEGDSDLTYSKQVNWNGKSGVLIANTETLHYSMLLNWNGVNVLRMTFDGCASEEEIRKAFESLKWSENE